MRVSGELLYLLTVLSSLILRFLSKDTGEWTAHSPNSNRY